MEWADSGTRLLAWAIVMLVLAVVAVALRLASRGCILHVLGLTDCFIVLTLLFSVINTVSIGFHVAYGLGHHVVDLTWEEIGTFFKVLYGSIIVNNLGVYLAKISVLLLFLDIFIVSWVRRATYVVIVLATLCCLWTTLSNIFFCIPIRKFWDFTLAADPDRKCIATPMKYYVDGSLNLALDFVMLFMPLPVIWHMNIPFGHKLWLYSVFVLGFSVCLISVARIYFVYDSLNTNDPTLSGLHIITWSMLEINLSIIIACIPTLKPLAAKLWPRLFTTPHSSETNLNGPNGLAPPPTISSPPRRPPCAGAEEV
ncbi:hypothetical protein MMYC01_209387 [Madurella mycetomatis]|uniref:Rhodopsin domain-containing protein n=1 Tax=Madurella mycetomatis TaxID=100816 RepID=A0A175VS53_9PEZI|nr:hypothetical protein MMYC01_210273 [Madurella mycetomatis]KXX74019.1 hypothetical protein MMYC01_209387 [Madurella mycetomatis]